VHILLLSSGNVYGNEEIVASLRKRGHDAKYVHLSSIFFDTGGETSVRDFDDVDAVLVRVTGSYAKHARLMAMWMRKKKKIVVDSRLANFQELGKIYSLFVLSSHGIRCPRTVHTANPKLLKKAIREFKLPLLVKPLGGRKGRGIKKFESYESVLRYISRRDSRFLIQEYIEEEADLRVFVTGDKALGCMRKIPKQGEFRANVALGAKTEVYNADDSIMRLAIRSAKILGIQIAGVDIAIDKEGKPWVLEVNRVPQFKAFQKTTGIDVPDAIAEYVDAVVKKGGEKFWSEVVT